MAVDDEQWTRVNGRGRHPCVTSSGRVCMGATHPVAQQAHARETLFHRLDVGLRHINGTKSLVDLQSEIVRQGSEMAAAVHG